MFHDALDDARRLARLLPTCAARPEEREKDGAARPLAATRCEAPRGGA